MKVLQNQFPNDFYVVSLSSENPLKVERFLSKKPNDLAVAIDYNKETFSKYNVRVLPDGVLFNAEGKVLWQGGAPDLKKETVSKFLRQQTKRSSVQSFFNIIADIEEINEEYKPSEDLEIKKLDKKLSDLELIDNVHYLKLNGPLNSIIGYLAKIYKNQIQLDEDLNASYEIYFKKPFNTNENLAYKLITSLGFEVNRTYDEGEGIRFTVEEPKFWDTNQIDWGKGNAKYLIGDTQIQGDNVSLRDIAYQLAYILDMPVILQNDSELNFELHDWDFHYKFFQLMQTDLEDNYGIKAEKTTVTFPIYNIQKKAP